MIENFFSPQLSQHFRDLATNELDAARRMRLSALARATYPAAPIRGAAQGLEYAARGLSHVPMALVSGLAEPATTLGPPIMRAAARAAENPDLAIPALGAAMLAPTAMSALQEEYVKNLEEANHMQRNPGSVRIAHEVTLNDFMAKVAAVPVGAFDNVTTGLGKGLGESFGKGLVERLLNAAGGGIDKILSMPARKRIIEQLFTSDPVISDALKRNPAIQRQLLEAYATMLKFAPSLTTDTNAVRSFLREVILGGGNVNYAVVKNLIDTERALHR